jgi:SSS family solute:Na+ symporter
METIMGIPMMYGIIGLAAFSAAYAIYGGLKAVAWTDVVQVFFLVGGGLVTTWLALAALGDGSGVIAGFTRLIGEFPEKFDMILDRSNPSYMELPGLSVLIGGMWIANISYWGCNQYIIQRALAAKSLPEAQNGLLFAAFLKLLMPLIVVIPGIVAFALSADIARPDQAYPWLLSNFVPVGLKGLTFAALIAAIASSLSSMTNSTSTIFTLDIYKNYINPAADDKQLVFVGRSVAFLALLVAVLVAPLLENFDQAFQFIQEFTGFISPGIVAIFLFGLFWKRASADGALWAAILTIPLSFLFKWLTPGIPFMNRMGIVFLIVSVVLVIISLRANKGDDTKSIAVPRSLFVTNTVFNVGSIVVSAILVVLYLLFW